MTDTIINMNSTITDINNNIMNNIKTLTSSPLHESLFQHQDDSKSFKLYNILYVDSICLQQERLEINRKYGSTTTNNEINEVTIDSNTQDDLNEDQSIESISTTSSNNTYDYDINIITDDKESLKSITSSDLLSDNDEEKMSKNEYVTNSSSIDSISTFNSNHIDTTHNNNPHDMPKLTYEYTNYTCSTISNSSSISDPSTNLQNIDRNTITPSQTILLLKYLLNVSKSIKNIAIGRNVRLLEWIVRQMLCEYDDKNNDIMYIDMELRCSSMSSMISYYAAEIIRSLTAHEYNDGILHVGGLIQACSFVSRLREVDESESFPSDQNVKNNMKLRTKIHAIIALMNLSCNKKNKVLLSNDYVLESIKRILLYKKKIIHMKKSWKYRLKPCHC